MEYIQVQKKDLKEWRHKQWLKQGKKCAVTNKPLAFPDSVVDHKHKTKKEVIGEDGKGLIRGVLHFGVNALEGKIANAYKRYALNKVAPLCDILRGLAAYIENPPVKNTVHPSSIPKRKKVSKTDIKRVFKYWKKMFPKRKEPKVPKYITEQWEEYINLSKKIHEETNGIHNRKQNKKEKEKKSRGAESYPCQKERSGANPGTTKRATKKKRRKRNTKV